MKRIAKNILTFALISLASCGGFKGTDESKNSSKITSNRILDIANYIRGSQESELFLEILKLKAGNQSLPDELISELDSTRKWEKQTEYIAPKTKKMMTYDQAQRYVTDNNLRAISISFYNFSRINPNKTIDSIVADYNKKHNTQETDRNEKMLRELESLGMQIRFYPEYNNFTYELNKMPTPQMYSEDSDKKRVARLNEEMYSFAKDLELGTKIDKAYAIGQQNKDYSLLYKLILEEVKTKRVAREAEEYITRISENIDIAPNELKLAKYKISNILSGKSTQIYCETVPQNTTPRPARVPTPRITAPANTEDEGEDFEE